MTLLEERLLNRLLPNLTLLKKVINETSLPI
jgi:hypothetical protein